MKYKSIPIKAAKDIAKAYDKDQVIIITWDKIHGRTHVTTYGKTLLDCDQAAQGGNMLKKALGWPPSLCKAKPARVKKKVSKKKEHQYQDFTDCCLYCGFNMYDGDIPEFCGNKIVKF